ncbi:hypothetical protein IWT25_02060 [Secundilactobacillus pentosiphilus]|uniref:DUF5640 domain-containing protein n=1 Tax=Secundilactobacillus pentosiphilus TaxID=1714682 RepID=A0A1Z5IY51_9LACO|nr:hypothetical protein [Secundilactobacillus pentosiphilus]GAX06713.1 hypothetical protein IWT25_02060 [Secundilactobacillus pentosiphilus]
MKQIGKVVLLTTLSLGLSFSAPALSNNTASAATKWHKGIPKVLQGTWKGKIKQGSLGFRQLKLTKSSFNYRDTSDKSWSTSKNAYYHHKRGSKYYYVKSTYHGEDGRKYWTTEYDRFKLSGTKVTVHIYGGAVSFKNHGKFYAINGGLTNSYYK